MGLGGLGGYWDEWPAFRLESPSKTRLTMLNCKVLLLHREAHDGYHTIKI